MRKVLKFYAEWCAPCKTLTQKLTQLASTPTIEEVDIDQQRQLVLQHNVRSVPTMIMMEDDGSGWVELKRTAGAGMTQEQLEVWLNG